MGYNVVIAAGGTGGHLFPGIAVAQEFQSRHGATVTFITTPKGVTGQILEGYGFAWEAFESRALKGQRVFGRICALLGVPSSIGEAQARLKALKPDLMLGLGGHTSGPVGIAAYRLGIPLAIHEQNAIPGFTNRCLARLASRVFVSFPASRSYFTPERCVWTGNPIREEFFQVNSSRPAAPFTVLITGGSQGAHHLNMATLEALGFLVDLKDRLLFLHITGEDDRDQVEEVYRETGFAAQVEAFTPEMANLMARAHLLVSRAGASTLAEIAAVGRAAVLIPYPFAANNHQEFNARFAAEVGAAEVVLNKDFTGEVLAGKIRQFMEGSAAREGMEEASRRLARPDAAKEIVKGCLELMESRAK